MSSLLDIKARLKAIESIRKITRAMELVAAAKFKRSEDRAKTARPYTEELDAVLRVLSGLADYPERTKPEESTFELSLGEGKPPVEVEAARVFEQPGEPAPTRPGLVLVTSDRGLCGAFNTKLVRAALEFIKAHPDMDVRLIPIGRKGYLYFKSRKAPIVHHEVGVSDKLSLEDVKRIARTLLDLFVTGEVDAVYIIFAQFKSVTVSTVRIDRFLAIPRVAGETQQEPYILEPDRKSVYAELLPLYATTKVFAALSDSFASEYGARMTAMQMATKNGEDLLQALAIERNRLRQAVITKELSEIVTSAAAQE